MYRPPRSRTLGLLTPTLEKWMRRVRLLVLPTAAAFVAMFAVAVPAYAATSYSWIGSAANSGGDNHSWTDAKNWKPAGIPGAGDSVSVAPPDALYCAVHIDTGVPTATLTSLALS